MFDVVESLELFTLKDIVYLLLQTKKGLSQLLSPPGVEKTRAALHTGASTGSAAKSVGPQNGLKLTNTHFTWCKFITDPLFFE